MCLPDKGGTDLIDGIVTGVGDVGVGITFPRVRRTTKQSQLSRLGAQVNDR